MVGAGDAEISGNRKAARTWIEDFSFGDEAVLAFTANDQDFAVRENRGGVARARYVERSIVATVDDKLTVSRATDPELVSNRSAAPELLPKKNPRTEPIEVAENAAVMTTATRTNNASRRPRCILKCSKLGA